MTRKEYLENLKIPVGGLDKNFLPENLKDNNFYLPLLMIKDILTKFADNLVNRNTIAQIHAYSSTHNPSYYTVDNDEVLLNKDKYYHIRPFAIDDSNILSEIIASPDILNNISSDGLGLFILSTYINWVIILHQTYSNGSLSIYNNTQNTITKLPHTNFNIGTIIQAMISSTNLPIIKYNNSDIQNAIATSFAYSYLWRLHQYTFKSKVKFKRLLKFKNGIIKFITEFSKNKNAMKIMEVLGITASSLNILAQNLFDSDLKTIEDNLIKTVNKSSQLISECYGIKLNTSFIIDRDFDSFYHRIVFRNRLHSNEYETHISFNEIASTFYHQPADLQNNKDAIIDFFCKQLNAQKPTEIVSSHSYAIFKRREKARNKFLAKCKNKTRAWFSFRLTPNHKYIYLATSDVTIMKYIISELNAEIKFKDPGLAISEEITLTTSSLCEYVFYTGFQSIYDLFSDITSILNIKYLNPTQDNKRTKKIQKKWEIANASIPRSYFGPPDSETVKHILQKNKEHKKEITIIVNDKPIVLTDYIASTQPLRFSNFSDNIEIVDSKYINNNIVMNKVFLMTKIDNKSVIVCINKASSDTLIDIQLKLKSKEDSDIIIYTNEKSMSTTDKCTYINSYYDDYQNNTKVNNPPSDLRIGISYPSCIDATFGKHHQPSSEINFITATDILIDDTSVFKEDWFHENITDTLDIIAPDKYNYYRDKLESIDWLWKYQKEDVATVCTKNRCIISSEMGSGKTRQQIAAAYIKDSKRTLFVTKRSYIQQFIDEFQKLKIKQPILITSYNDYIINKEAKMFIVAYEDLILPVYNAAKKLEDYTKSKDIEDIYIYYKEQKKQGNIPLAKRKSFMKKLYDIEIKLTEKYDCTGFYSILELIKETETRVNKITLAEKLRYEFNTISYDEAHLITDPAQNRTAYCTKRLKAKNKILATGTAITKGPNDLKLYYKNYISNSYGKQIDISREYSGYNISKVISNKHIIYPATSRDFYYYEYQGASAAEHIKNKQALTDIQEFVIGNRLDKASMVITDKFIGYLKANSYYDNSRSRIYHNHKKEIHKILPFLKNAKDNLFNLRNTITVRRIAQEKQLKDKLPSEYKIRNVWINADKDHITEYLQYINDYKTWLNNEETQKVQEIKNNLMKLVRASFISNNGSSRKLDALKHIITTELEMNNKSIVFFNIKDHALIADKFLKNAGINVINTVNSGSIKRAKQVKAFKEGDEDVLIMTSRTGSHAYDIPEANIVIFAEDPWQYYIKDQGIHRVLRPGQEKEVIIYSLINKGMVDEYIHTTVENRKTFSSNIMDRTKRIMIDSSTYTEVSDKLMTATLNINDFQVLNRKTAHVSVDENLVKVQTSTKNTQETKKVATRRTT